MGEGRGTADAKFRTTRHAINRPLSAAITFGRNGNNERIQFWGTSFLLVATSSSLISHSALSSRHAYKRNERVE